MTLLTVRAAAERLGIGYSTLKQWIYQGRIRTTQTAGGHHRIADAEVDRLVARQNPTQPRVAPSRPTAGLIVALSGRNRLRGFVEEVRIDGLLGQVRLRIGDQMLTAIITGDAIQDLKLGRGDEALAIIKSTEVMIGRETDQAASLPSTRPRRSSPRSSGRAAGGRQSTGSRQPTARRAGARKKPEAERKRRARRQPARGRRKQGR